MSEDSQWSSRYHGKGKSALQSASTPSEDDTNASASSSGRQSRHPQQTWSSSDWVDPNPNPDPDHASPYTHGPERSRASHLHTVEQSSSSMSTSPVYPTSFYGYSASQTQTPSDPPGSKQFEGASRSDVSPQGYQSSPSFGYGDIPRHGHEHGQSHGYDRNHQEDHVYNAYHPQQSSFSGGAVSSGSSSTFFPDPYANDSTLSGPHASLPTPVGSNCDPPNPFLPEAHRSDVIHRPPNNNGANRPSHVETLDPPTNPLGDVQPYYQSYSYPATGPTLFTQPHLSRPSSSSLIYRSPISEHDQRHYRGIELNYDQAHHHVPFQAHQYGESSSSSSSSLSHWRRASDSSSEYSAVHLAGHSSFFPQYEATAALTSSPATIFGRASISTNVPDQEYSIFGQPHLHQLQHLHRHQDQEDDLGGYAESIVGPRMEQFEKTFGDSLYRQPSPVRRATVPHAGPQGTPAELGEASSPIKTKAGRSLSIPSASATKYSPRNLSPHAKQERRRMQNRLAQRAFRARKKEKGQEGDGDAVGEDVGDAEIDGEKEQDDDGDYERSPKIVKHNTQIPALAHISPPLPPHKADSDTNLRLIRLSARVYEYQQEHSGTHDTERDRMTRSTSV